MVVASLCDYCICHGGLESVCCMDTEKIEILEGLFGAAGDLLKAGQTGDMFNVLQSLDRSIAVLETMREMVEVDHPLHQEIRDKIEEISRVRSSLSFEM